MKPWAGINYRQQTGVIFLLIVAFAAQVLLPLQSHTYTVVTKTGKVVVLCTLQGMRSFQLDDEGQIGEAISAASNQESAAYRFSQLLAYSSPSLSEFYLAPFKSVAIDFTDTIRPVFSQDTSQYFFIRAPPLLS